MIKMKMSGQYHTKTTHIKASSRGFTLIEVVLVLAIGGLIFLLAFLAFGQASKNRRNTQRRSDASRILAEFENYKADAGGTGRGLLTEGRQTSSICVEATSSDIAYGLFYQSFASKYLCKNGTFSSPLGVDYGTTGYTSVPVTKDSIQFFAPGSAYTSSINGVGTKACDGTTQLNVGEAVIRIGLEGGGVICRDSRG